MGCWYLQVRLPSQQSGACTMLVGEPLTSWPLKACATILPLDGQTGLPSGCSNHIAYMTATPWATMPVHDLFTQLRGIFKRGWLACPSAILPFILSKPDPVFAS